MFEDKEEIVKREKADPHEGDRPWPLSIWLLLLVMCSFGFGYLLVFTGDGTLGGGDSRAGSSFLSPPIARQTDESDRSADPSVDLFDEGRRVYQSLCAACHQPTGAGIAGAFPPLDNSSWVTGDASIPAKIVLHGIAGPIEVNGLTYNGVMPAFGGQLDDRQVAAVVSYIRGAWSNQSPPIDAQSVKSLREAHGTRGAWSADELRAQ